MKSRTVTTVLFFEMIVFYIDFLFYSKIFIIKLLQIKLDELYRVFINYQRMRVTEKYHLIKNIT